VVGGGLLGEWELINLSGVSTTISKVTSCTTTAADITATDDNRRSPRLGDDCLLVYLDVGSNIGVHNRFLLEPELYPDAKDAVRLFNSAFGPPSLRDNQDICAFGFEPNPAHKKRHLQLEEVYKKMGWRYHYIPAGVSDRVGNMTFFHKSDGNNEEWGFSMVRLTPNDRAEVVPIIHLTEWLQHHIVERKLPTTIHGNYSDPGTRERGKVVMKMDAEGAEYAVLPNLLFSGVFCQSLDIVFGEAHPRVAHLFNRDSDQPDRQGELKIGDRHDARQWFNTLAERVLKSMNPADCRGRWLYLDDESYLHDGQPFPVPKNDTESKS